MSSKNKSSKLVPSTVAILNMSTSSEDENPVASMIGQPPAAFPEKGPSCISKDLTNNEKDEDYEPESSDDSDSSNKSDEEAILSEEQPAESSASAASGTRWRRAEPEKRHGVKIKKLRAFGEGFVDEKGKERSAKSVVEFNHSHKENSGFKCSEFTAEDRKAMFDAYWQKGEDYKSKKEFLLQYTEKASIKRKRTENEDDRKKFSFNYFLCKDRQKLRVCREFFTKTLSISYKPIATAHAKKSEANTFVGDDMRGQHPPIHKIKPEVLQSIKDHIESFPCMESHYCRKDSNRKYLDPKLSITKMYELYKESTMKPADAKVSFQTYQKVFGTEYNLSFFKPRKDQCVQCSVFESQKDDASSKEELKKEYDEHIARKETARCSLKNDIALIEADPNLIVATMDLQSVLQIPQSGESAFYYKRKLCFYNLTIYVEGGSKEGYCYVWSEIDGKRGSSEIGTCVYQFIKDQCSNGKTKFKFWSDNCGGQNRNKFLTAMELQAVQELPIEFIEHNYLERGHTQMSVDSMHSAIETAAKNLSIYSPIEWCNVMKIARRHKPYKVIRLSHKDFFDLKKMNSDLVGPMNVDDSGNRVNWLKIKVLRVSKDKPGIVQLKDAHDLENFKAVDASTRKKRGRPSAAGYEWPLLYFKPLPISNAKKSDLLSLCGSRLIPEEYHSWINSLDNGEVLANCEGNGGSSESENNE